ncbi:hypothetical protein OKJ48_29460 [Streptomyces kunmingensis]|uniref:Uncharacterized protein n=1 Tax=Streptomyces kunmingensis TaxID=68225 RepID=A0ABU6CHY1_9ACTN|nr:hypothetical protein [Streptomyces kunmingensis]MEB3964330.1 hypothetical protein [Streptomyces kunmingensis]
MSARTGSQVFRVAWLPGTDQLSGRCHCGALHTCQDPVAMWEWMLAHPDHPDQPGTESHPGTGVCPGTEDRLSAEEDRTP